MARDGTDPAPSALRAHEDSDGSELLGTVVDGRYHLECMLGRGGMGLVYRAAHVGLRRQVAVKILHPSLAASSDVRSRFEREALAVGKIDHPHCVSVYDVGRLPDGSLYLAMELLDGRPLADVLEQEGQVAPGRALHILAGILRGLAHIHQAGLIHRDIKPENIFLIRQGQDEDFAKILDFGIAKPMEKTSLDDGVKLTQAGMAFGTPIYMAPEQALGNPMDGRADLYAAAVLGYEMLCGQPPFYSDDKLEVMSMHTARPVPAMRTRLIKGGRAIPSSIERLIAKGLTKKPSERYASAEVFLAAVEDALKTPDGGVTDVSFERPDTTGSQPLVTDDGRVRITGASELAEQADHAGRAGIADAIDEALAIPGPAAKIAAAAPRAATPPQGQGQFRMAPHNRPGPAMGGVGLGLPYTGPTGEPIFGLTPEQRLATTLHPDMSMASALEPEAQKASATRIPRKKWLLYGGVLALAVAAGVVFAIVSAPDGGDGPDPETPAGRAFAAFERLEYDEAMKILDANQATIASDPDGQLVLGKVHGAKNQLAPMLNAYATALALDANLGADTRLRNDLRVAASHQDPALAAAAFEVWLRSEDADAKPALFASLRTEDVTRRHVIRDMVERIQLGDLRGNADYLFSYTLDLQQLKTCPERKKVVEKLRGLDDPRAVPDLERAMQKKAKQGNKLVPLNACLLDDARAAIGYLNGLQK